MNKLTRLNNMDDIQLTKEFIFLNIRIVAVHLLLVYLQLGCICMPLRQSFTVLHCTKQLLISCFLLTQRIYCTV